jgi:hypothetical protein
MKNAQTSGKTDKRVIEYVALDKLTPYARNSRTHSPEQVKQIAASIREFGFTNPVLIDDEGTIIAGHGRVLAAQHLQLAEVPCIRLGYLTETQRRAYVIADNRIAEIGSGWDLEMLKNEVEELQIADKWELRDLLAEIGDSGEVESAQPEVVFSEIMNEANNYVVLIFDNEIDWLSAMTHFELTSKYSKRTNGKPWSAGIGRVIDGAQYLNRIKGEK